MAAAGGEDGSAVRLRGWGATVDVAGPGWATAHLGEGIDATVGPVPDDGRRPADAAVALVRSARGWAVVGGVGPGWHRAGADVGARAEAARRLRSEAHLLLAAHATEAVFVHAGAVAWRGVGVVVPARTMAGKSTLVRALVDQGATYLSDEYAVLDPAGRVHPFARPLSWRGAGGTEAIPGARLGRVATGPVPVGVVVETAFAAGATWAPETVRGAAVALPLVANAVAARRVPVRVTDHVAAVARGGAVLLRGPRGEAAGAAAAILAAVPPGHEVRGSE